MKIVNSKSILLLLLVVAMISSCSKKESFPTDDNQVIIDTGSGLTFRKASLRDQPVDFVVYDEQGNEISENITFYVDGTALDGNTFQSSSEGSFEIYAQYEIDGTTYVTETDTFSVIIPKQKIMLEDYTGAWCGYCPAVSAAIEAVAAQTDDISTVAIHNQDEIALSIEAALRNEFAVGGFPSGRINRTTTWGSILTFPTTQVTDIAGQEVPVAISINSSVNSGVLSVQIHVASENELQDKKLVVYLTEDGILLDQTNYFNNDETSPYYGLGNPIIDFEQNHVLRASLTDPFGDAIPSTSAYTDYEFTTTYSIPSNFVVEKLHLVAMVVEASDNSAVNTQNAAVNAFKPYE
ncbi:MAG: Omp28-related outer membrane protein [Flavobacteriaceae bacterium]